MSVFKEDNLSFIKKYNVLILFGILVTVLSLLIWYSLSYVEPQVESVNDIIKHKFIEYCGWDDMCWAFDATMRLHDGESEVDGAWKVELMTFDGLSYFWLDVDEELPSKEEMCWMGYDFTLGGNCEERILHAEHIEILDVIKGSHYYPSVEDEKK